MSDLKYIRSGRTIKTLAFKDGNRDSKNDTTKSFKSIGLAKRESHKLQMSADGALGRGSLMVAK